MLASVLHYLHDLEDFFAETDDVDDTFPKPKEISDIVINLLRQLKYKDTSSEARTSNTTPADTEGR